MSNETYTFGCIVKVAGHYCIVADLGGLPGGGHYMGLINLKTGMLHNDKQCMVTRDESFKLFEAQLRDKFQIQKEQNVTKLSDSLESLIKSKPTNRHLLSLDELISDFLHDCDSITGNYNWRFTKADKSMLALTTRHPVLKEAFNSRDLYYNVSHDDEDDPEATRTTFTIKTSRLYELYDRPKSAIGRKHIL